MGVEVEREAMSGEGKVGSEELGCQQCLLTQEEGSSIRTACPPHPEKEAGRQTQQHFSESCGVPLRSERQVLCPCWSGGLVRK